jgi:hypothetical protein
MNSIENVEIMFYFFQEYKNSKGKSIDGTTIHYMDFWRIAASIFDSSCSSHIWNSWVWYPKSKLIYCKVGKYIINLTMMPCHAYWTEISSTTMHLPPWRIGNQKSLHRFCHKTSIDEVSSLSNPERHGYHSSIRSYHTNKEYVIVGTLQTGYTAYML